MTARKYIMWQWLLFIGLVDAVFYHGNGPTTMKLHRSLFTITPSYVRGPFNLSIELQYGKSITPLVSFWAFDADTVLITDRRQRDMAIYGIYQSEAIVAWRQPLTAGEITQRCTVAAFYTPEFAARPAYMVESIMTAVNQIYEHTVFSGERRGFEMQSIAPMAVDGADMYDLSNRFAMATGAEALRCVNILFHNTEYSSGIVGLAYIEGSCTTDNSIVVSYPNPAVLVVAAAHEIGHGWGSDHDTGVCAGRGYLMEAYLDTASTAFSPCSLDVMNAWLTTAELGPCWVTGNATSHTTSDPEPFSMGIVIGSLLGVFFVFCVFDYVLYNPTTGYLYSIV